jgi:hypothetical protein
MKFTTTLPALAALLLAGCVYEAPLVVEHKIAIDPAVLGLWEEIPDTGQTPGPDHRMMILKFSDTEYLVHYPTGSDGIYYRAYPVKIGGLSCVQLQVLGTKDGPPRKDQNTPFHAASYRLADGKLEIKTLNKDLVDEKLKTTKDLAAAFLARKDDAALFTNPGSFRKIKE